MLCWPQGSIEGVMISVNCGHLALGVQDGPYGMTVLIVAIGGAKCHLPLITLTYAYLVVGALQVQLGEIPWLSRGVPELKEGGRR